MPIANRCIEYSKYSKSMSIEETDDIIVILWSSVV